MVLFFSSPTAGHIPQYTLIAYPDFAAAFYLLTFITLLTFNLSYAIKVLLPFLAKMIASTFLSKSTD